MRPTPTSSSRARVAARQRGVIMVIALITLAVLLIGAAITMRSMNATLSSVGNFGFKRDMANRAELGIRAATTALQTGVLSGNGARDVNNAAANYSASMLPSDPSGIPLAMLNLNSPSDINGQGSAGNEIVIANEGLRIVYLIDRFCATAGVFSQANCLVQGSLTLGGSNGKPLLIPPQPTYRITVRVSGPRNAYSFFQSTYTTLN
ncbi:hypothetical protein [Roseateles sp.]|uniref:pilus assembly PilX family protein n=1 Tax=Roseateles sp. TaxID=1971397 RepID=UPI0031E3B16D